MADANRALPMHEVGTTPTTPRSVPVVIKKTVTIPAPPGSGTFVLTSTNGVLSWAVNAA